MLDFFNNWAKTGQKLTYCATYIRTVSPVFTNISMFVDKLMRVKKNLHLFYRFKDVAIATS